MAYKPGAQPPKIVSCPHQENGWQIVNLQPEQDNYCVMGHPVMHSLSPLIHSLFAKQTSQNIYYQAIQPGLDQFPETLSEFQQKGGKGLNITLPFKELAFELSDVLTTRAEKAKAVNTMWFDEGGKRHGDNTDGAGLINDLIHNQHLQLKSTRILILGAGGAVRGILDPLINQNPELILIANRTRSKAEILCEEFASKVNLIANGYNELPGNQFDLVINATSASLQGLMPSLPDDILSENACCYDLMYSREDTVFMSWSKIHGATLVVDGIGMLVEQAAEAFLQWRGIKPDTTVVIDQLKQPAAGC